MRVLDALAQSVADASPDVQLSTLLYPFFGLIIVAIIAAVGNVAVARIGARKPAAASSGTGPMVAVSEKWLSDLVESERMLAAIVATRLPHVDPTTGLDR